MVSATATSTVCAGTGIQPRLPTTRVRLWPSVKAEITQVRCATVCRIERIAAYRPSMAVKGAASSISRNSK